MGKTKVKNKLPPFVPMTWVMLNSKAYKELPPSACKMLPYFLGKVKLLFRDTQYYWTEFSFPYSEGKRFGCAKKTFFEVVKALMKFGFIDPVKKGGLKGFKHTASIYKLSRRWEVYGTASFEQINWECFGTHQIQKQVQNLHCVGA
jgi:hypothetical protein